MRLFHFASSCLLLATVSVAAPVQQDAQLERRDLPTISGVLNTIMWDLVKMTQVINAFDGDAVKAVPVLEAAEKTLADIRAGTPTVEGASDLGLFEAAGVLLPVGALYNAAKKLVTDITAKKDLFDQAGVSFVVQDKLAEFQELAGKLVNVTIKKIPAYLSIISTPIAGSITGQLDNAAVAFGLNASKPLEYASLGDVASSLAAGFATIANSTASAAATPAAPAPAPTKSASSGFSLASLFGGKSHR